METGKELLPCEGRGRHFSSSCHCLELIFGLIGREVSNGLTVFGYHERFSLLYSIQNSRYILPQLTEADAVVIHRPATLLVAHIPLHSSAV